MPLERKTRLIVSVAPPRSYAPLARIKLSQAGYSVLSEERWAEMYGRVARPPDLVIVDQERAAACAALPALAHAPRVLLLGRGEKPADEPNVVGALARPASFEDLYALVQRALETTPRAAPRVAIKLPARIRAGQGSWDVYVVSLSSGGCLVHREQQSALGERIALDFELPRFGRLEAIGETVHQRPGEVGVAFRELSAPARRWLQSFVEEQLLEA